VSGRANDGGLRIGEMERDSVISHGAANFLNESMMERGDKYYMAVCNHTGMVAIYNPGKNLFLSPMADGPIQFVGSLDGKEMNIETVSMYGRNFSVVCIPYTLKLLIQELQTINVQMRVITEDNIEQLENMTYSKNIDKLTNVAGITEKQIIETVRNLLLPKQAKPILRDEPTPLSEERTDKPVLMSPEDTGFWETGNTPVQSPITNQDMYPRMSPGSPAYVPTSPAYVPTQEEMSKYSVNSNSPMYNPVSPVMYQPTTPSMTPTQQASPVTLDTLSEKAQEFQVGERVLFRGDTIPTRLWTVTYIGDHFIKIEPDTMDALSPKDSVKIVTFMDIYRPGDLLYQPTPAFPMSQQSMIDPNRGFAGQSPSINIKVIGGNDYSTDLPETSNMTGQSPTNFTVEGSKVSNPPLEIRELPTAAAGPSPVVSTADDLTKGFVVKKV
jgi:hypothetical protein